MNRSLPVVVTVLIVGASVSFAQTTPNVPEPTRFMQQFAQARFVWFNAIFGYVRNLFVILAGIEFAWSMTEFIWKHGMYWDVVAAAFVRKIIFMGAWLSLLLFGATWIPLIIDSFARMGQEASGLHQPLSPGDIFTRGFNIAGHLDKAASDAGYFTNFGTAFGLEVASILIVIAFTAIMLQFTVTTVESYILVAAGVIFLGFGGSRWTQPYTERYIGSAVALGVKLLCIYLIVGVGMQISSGWALQATLVGSEGGANMGGLEIACSALVFATFAWAIPKWVSGVLGGAPALTGSDVVGMASGIGVAAATGASMAVSAGTAGLIGGQNGVNEAGAAVSPGTNGTSGSAGRGAPSHNGGPGGSRHPIGTALPGREGVAGSGSGSRPSSVSPARAAKGAENIMRRIGSAIPNDGGASSSGPALGGKD